MNKFINLKNWLMENDNSIYDIAITLPGNIPWTTYQQELEKVKDGTNVLNFKVPNLPKYSAIGKKCYLNYKGNLIGWMKITGFSKGSFNCNTTGKIWEGNFIQRSGPFNSIIPIPMKGFRGFKYIK
ncbi:hypothetical protein M0Q50_07160 [bacterium]|jgi:hypothetical protein|nr:hypothetical protein [bacterium]